MTLIKSITVLIIDDDEDDRFFMEQAFKTDSPATQLYLAPDGQQALDLLGAAQPLPDVVILDLNMPGLNGFDVLERLKQSWQYRHIPVVILTTSNSADDQEQCRRLGATEFITKPTTYSGLSNIAQRIRLSLLS